MSDARFTLFVYGTLKRGGRYHARFAGGARAIEPACVRGRLYMLPDRYPVLVVSPEHVLAEGSEDARADARVGTATVPTEDGRGWDDEVKGELLLCDDPETSLPEIDRLEDFHPRGESLYRRVLVAARRLRDGVLVSSWTYVEGERLRREAIRTPGSRRLR